MQFKISRFPLTLALPFLSVLWQKINFGKADLHLLKSSKFYISKPVLCFTIPLPQKVFGESRTGCQFLKYCFLLANLTCLYLNSLKDIMFLTLLKPTFVSNFVAQQTFTFDSGCNQHLNPTALFQKKKQKKV